MPLWRTDAGACVPSGHSSYLLSSELDRSTMTAIALESNLFCPLHPELPRCSSARYHTAHTSFTPTCSSQVPGFLADADKFSAKGVNAIYVVAVNDLFVMNAWKKNMGAPEQVKFGESLSRGDGQPWQGS